MSAAWIALGSNLGDRSQYLELALRRLDDHPAIQVAACSHIYETEPVGYLEQPRFLNMAAELQTSLKPLELLQFMLEVERALGRERTIPNGPRTVDLDLLMYENETLSTDELVLPHPRMVERAFVLIPFADVRPEFEFIRTSLDKLHGKEDVTLWKKTSWRRGSGLFGS
ncbi:2-amino-4-hydroxy-6-hydroxymethyldihydropteridine diphosphokinase [Paenibacillus turpanensis]|uniref:2-amino-4-hydroxy-6- hydroxymethyldihydropteridine diphosphokinase n=1 Tax=Paenibacillus turpanensis TaxID=2689078 RepID=UPI00140C1E95|nr:2-amino-4-hydroxy-6-hydroxymethyldihydropteridine diphosphokinase [Paenibacillus turpanensis]